MTKPTRVNVTVYDRRPDADDDKENHHRNQQSFNHNASQQYAKAASK